MGYQTAPHGSLGLPYGLYQFMSLTEGTPLLFESELVLSVNISYQKPPYLATLIQLLLAIPIAICFIILSCD